MTDKTRHLLKLVLPILFAQLGVVLLSVVDTAMLAHFSKEALQASALANVWILGTLNLGIGILLGLDPFISQASGS